MLFLISVFAGQGCDVCNLMVQNVRKNVKNPTKANIDNYLKSFCKTLPSAIKKHCDEIVSSSYYTQFVAGIAAGKSADVVCKEVGAC